MRRVGVATLSLVAVACAALVVVTPASAYITPPVTVTPPVTTTSPPGAPCFVSLDCSYTYKPWMRNATWKVGVARGFFPRVSGLGTLTLGVGAFALGWKIGRTLDTQWLHVSGDIGTTTNYTNGDYRANATGWEYVSSTTERTTPGWRALWRVVQISTGSVISSGTAYCTWGGGTPGAFSTTSWPAIKTAMEALPGQAVTVDASSCAGQSSAQTKFKWLTENTGVSGDPVSAGGYGAPSMYGGTATSPSGAGLRPDVGPEPFVSQTFTVTTSHAVTSGRLTSPTTPEAEGDRAAIQTSAGGDTDPLENEYNCIHDPDNFACPDETDPYGEPGGAIDYFTIPACVGLYTYAGCVAALTAAGYLGTITRVDRTTPDTETAPNRVTQLSPAAGGSIPVTGAITITVNVAEEDYPYAMPAPLPLEDFAAYMTRVYTIYPWLGPGFAWSPDVTEVPLTMESPLYDPEKGPGEIVQISPTPGLEHTPTAAPPYTFTTNPPDAPLPPVGGDSDDSDCPCPIAEFDFSPLAIEGGCETFPFGVICWFAEQVDALFLGGPVPPAVTFNPGPLDLSPFGTLDLAPLVIDAADLPESFNTFITVLRTVLTFVVWLVGLWYAGSHLLGVRHLREAVPEQ
jgi:hypothetical protein